MEKRIVFFGTSEFAVDAFETLRSLGITPSLVVTETDKPKGRGHKLAAPPVKEWAERNGFSVFQPKTLKEPSAQERLKKESADVFLVAAYGKLLPKSVLEIPEHGTLNIHPSLLPKYRGPSPIRAAIVQDDRNTGVSIIRLDELMDHGPIVAQKSLPFPDWPPAADEAEQKLAREGASLFAETISDYLSGKIKPLAQEDARATLTKKTEKRDGLIDLAGDAYKNWLLFRAYSSSPGVFFLAKRGNKEIKIKIVEAEFANGSFKILRVIPENKNEMPYEDFLRGLR